MATSNKQNESTTQKFLDIYDITNDLVILKDGTTSLIITVDAMNFGLLAEEEQDSIMYAYAGLLNSLNYPIQILIKSQTKDVTGYLNLLKEQEDAAVNHTQRHRIMKYREFVSNLIRERNVLDKKFYVTIPAKPLELGLVPIASVIPGKNQTDISSIDKTMVIEKAKSILEPKRDHLIAQFARIGLYSRQLETQEIIQMFYQSYNPEAFEGQHMDNSRSYTAPLVSASIEGNNMDNPNPAATPAAPTQPSTPAPAAPVVTAQAPTPPPDPVNSETPTPPVAAPVVTPEPTLQPTTPITPSSEPTTDSSTPATSGYSPTKMETPAPAAPTPVPADAGTPASNPITTPDVPSITPTPPAPELPKTEPGQVDTDVNQEVEIKIEHPSEKGTVVPISATPAVTPAPVNTTTLAPTTPTENNESDAKPMPPLPEIK